MKNVSKFLTAAFVIGVFCTIDLPAQENGKSAGSVKGGAINDSNEVKSKRSEAEYNINRLATKGTLIFCGTADESAAASYRLKVWQLKQGQTAETAMQSNEIVVTKTQHAINTKGAGGVDKTAAAGDNSEAIKVCSESIRQANAAAADHAINTKGAGANDIATTDATAKHAINTKGAGSGDRAVTNPQTTLNPMRAFAVDNFPVCAGGTSCDYVYAVEALNAAGNPVNPNIQPIIVKFGINWKTGRVYFEIVG